MRRRVLIVGFGLWLGASSYGGQSRYDQVYDRAMAKFEAATFFKPAGTNSEDLVFRLAPLILAVGGKTDRTPTGFGALVMSNRVAAVDTSAPAVYFDSGVVLFGGKPHLQLVYVWFYQRPKSGLLVQGVRMTLGSAGEPVIWEVLRDTLGAQPVFVAHSLEQAAAKEHGPPLADRRYSLEPGIKTAPKIVVARVIEDGPVPMGPMVYVENQSGDVATVLCRCMPPEFKNLAGERTYKLVPLTSARSASQNEMTALKGEPSASELFDKLNPAQTAFQDLRLPAKW